MISVVWMVGRTGGRTGEQSFWSRCLSSLKGRAKTKQDGFLPCILSSFPLYLTYPLIHIYLYMYIQYICIYIYISICSLCYVRDLVCLTCGI